MVLYYNFYLPLINQWVLSFQVIYKKFNIKCPLESAHFNMTSYGIHDIDINGTDDFCEAKMFTINSQVRGETSSSSSSFLSPASSFCLGQQGRFTATCSAPACVMSTAVRRAVSTAASSMEQASNCVPYWT